MYGDTIETWKKLAVKFGLNDPRNIKLRYKHFLESIEEQDDAFTMDITEDQVHIVKSHYKKAKEDKIILEHVKIYGDTVETWKTLAIKLGRKHDSIYRRWYKHLLVNEPSVRGSFTPEEDNIILDNVEKYGQGYNTWGKTAKQLNRGVPESIRKRHDYLTSNQEKTKWKKWSLLDDKKLLEVILKALIVCNMFLFIKIFKSLGHFYLFQRKKY